jgi:Tfp pilus assembly protein PilF
MIWFGLGVLGPSAAFAQSSTPSVTSSITSGVTQSVERFGQAVTPAPTPPEDPVSLRSKGKPGVELYVAVARLYEENGNFADAEAEYKRAEKVAPNDLRYLLGYAHLKDHVGEPAEALKLYQKAAKAHPDEPSVFNNLAVHFARQKMLREAADALDRAVQLRPREPRYRNNMATLMVELNRPEDAFNQFRAIYDEPISHYNLGFLLNKHGDREGAIREFAAALQLRPQMVQAKQWLDRLSTQQPGSAPAGFGMPPAPQSVGPAPGSQPPQYREQSRVATSAALPVPMGGDMPPMPPGDASPLVRLPPVGAPAQDDGRYPVR